MASEGPDEVAANLNLTIEEKQLYGQVFRQADPENVGIVIGEVAVKFFERTHLDSSILGEIWQIADRENRGFLTPAGFGVALRLIGHAQAGKAPSAAIALQHGPLPRFDTADTPAGAASQRPLSANATGPLSAQGTGTGAQRLAAQGTGAGAASRVPPLSPEKAAQYARVFQDQTKGEPVMSGEVARRIFEKSGLNIETLGRIWQLADTEQRGALVQTEFVIAMHLLTSTKMGTLRALPAMLPAGLYEAATRGVAAAASGSGGHIGAAVGSPASPVARQQSPLAGGAGFGAAGILPPPPTQGISRQLTGHMRPAPPNFSNSPLGRAAAPAAPASSDWLITPAEKARMDPVFQSLDKAHKGYITGDEAVPFLTRSGLDEDTLAQIWDLADVNSDGHLTSDTFAVALHLIQQQRQGGTLPPKLPPNLVPPSLRSKVGTTSPPPAAAPPPPPPQPKSAMDDLFGLDSGPSSAPSLPALAATPTGASASGAGLSDPFATASSPVQPSSPTRPSVATTSFKPFVPSSSFGRSLTAQVTGDSNSSAPSATARAAPPLPQQPSGTQQSVFSPGAAASSSTAQNDLLGGDDGEASRNLSNDTADLANLSNQISSLSNHMQETATHRKTLENELSQTSAQKKNFEQRLVQLRALYEKEARDVRALEEQLKTSRSDTKTLQTQVATLEASYQDLQTQRQTISSALQADQQENASLKERMKVVSAEVNQLKPQIEKLKSEARQQKGIVAINRKQLSLGESEREKLKTEAEDLTRQNQDLARQIHNASVSSAASSGASPSVASASGKNPFFRRTGSSDIMGVFTSPTQGSPSLSSVAAAKPFGEKSFDDVFGPAPGASATASPSATHVVPAAPAAVSAIKPQFTGASTGSSSFSAVTAPTSETATPGISRQGTDITPTAAPETAAQSAFSPFPTTATSPPPAAAAVAAPPAPASVASPAASVTSPAERASATASPAPAAAQDLPTSSSPAPDAAKTNSSVFSGIGAAAAVTAATAGVAAVASNTSGAASPASDADKGKSIWSQGHAANDSLSDPFTAMDQQQDKAKEDFESAFASFKAARAAESSGDDDAFEVKTPAAAAAPSASSTKEEDPVSTDASKAFANFHSEFPPISELHNDESDSDSDGGGFDDDFAPASPKNNHSKAAESTPAATIPEAANGEPAISKPASPELAKSVPAPAESDIFSSAATTTPDIFSAAAPAAAAAPATTTSMDDIFSAPAAAAPATTIAPAVPPAAAPTTTASEDEAFDKMDDDDDDDDFEGLEDAREGSADDDFAQFNRSGIDDFNSAFDSSPPVKGDSGPSFGNDSSFDFSTLGASSTSTGTAAAASQGVNGAKTASADPGDWFSFDEAKPAATEAAPAAPAAEASAAPAAGAEDAARPATLSRLDTQNSTNDDPILRQLTSMGYARSVALSALEKYDYNVDRAANYLASQS